MNAAEPATFDRYANTDQLVRQLVIIDARHRTGTDLAVYRTRSNIIAELERRFPAAAAHVDAAMDLADFEHRRVNYVTVLTAAIEDLGGQS